ncbi:DUF4214 domain-containing protein [Actinotalea sp. M2MS4P-6]|uniref:DUF4214 domain-containing protein n=1 Tax=Actinotalea sp. M2MS4P-6 TaxID=2983762 RepID=UPI0021E47C3C|nr:DUF4214 domain-containing protein [Actinotalea sp. M2MS4P-6]MCV2394176.1 DUF4214 domain-containing protein [Actinotalea sp. M2MS4P-6]
MTTRLTKRVSAVAAGVLALALTSSGVASASGPLEISVEGTLLQIAVDSTDTGTGDGLDVVTMVRVGSTVVEVPEEIVVPGRTGDAAVVTVVAPAGYSAAEALTEAASPSIDDRAEVVAVDPAPTAAAMLAASPATALGVHTLTILPVYTSDAAPSSPSAAALQSLGEATSDYWSAQSAGQIQISATTRPWVKVADPGSCNEATLLSEALAANAMAAPDSRNHVLVYFPERADCGGWAGYASIGGGVIWVNGAPLLDVFAHEFGHNLGLGHANRAQCASGGTRVPLSLPISSCTRIAYGDYTDVMGIAMAGVPTGNLNTALADSLGLVTAVRVGVGQSASVDLARLGEVTSVRAVTLGTSGGTVYIDYRPAVSPDTRVPSWAGVQVLFRTIDPIYGFPTSYLLDMTPASSSAFRAPALAAGATFTEPLTGTSVTVERVGTTASLRVVSLSEQVRSYISRVYRDLFHRSVDSAGLQTWTTALLSGVPRVEVANSITGSDEYRTRLIQGAYRTYLGRSADSSGLAFWLRELRDGRRITDLEAGFIASDEYYARAGGTDAGWVRRLYRDVLGRSPASSEVAGWLPTIRSSGRYAVARGFLLSSEHLTDVVDAYYRDLLGRRIDSQGRATWVNAIQRGARLEEIIGSIVASDEYYRLG